MYGTISGRKIRIGLVGCGRISARHFESIDAHSDDMELVAVCDSDDAVLQKLGPEISANRYSRLEAMLAQESLDIVSLCTPSGLHSAQAILVAETRRHVITEKPMATCWSDGLRMVKACEQASVNLFVVKQNRRNSTLQLLKRAIDEKRFGKIHLVSLNVFWTRPQEYYDSAAWRGTWELDGGALMNQASHYVDLIDWLIGPVAEVQAMTGTLGREIEVEDTGVLNIRWRSGALGSMSVTMLTYPTNLEASITVIGEKGTVRIAGVAVNEIRHWKFDVERDYDQSIEQASYSATSVYGFGHSSYYRNVIDVLRGDAAPETDGREGLKSLEILIAAYLSTQAGKVVSLPLEY